MPRIAGDNPSYSFRLMRSGPGGSQVSTQWGFELPSVTTIISKTIAKPFSAGAWYGYKLAQDGGPDPNEALKVAATRGMFAHDCLEALALGESESKIELKCRDEYNKHKTKYSQAVLAWWRENKRAKWRPEQPVFSLKHGYAGTADLISAHEIVDLKTHKPMSGFTKPGQGPAYLSDLIQLRAYRTAWQEMSGATTTGNRILIARENGTWLEDNREVPESLWLQCLSMYKELSVISNDN